MSELTKDQKISNIYYDFESGYGSIRNTYNEAKKVDPSITYEDVKQWMSKQPNKQRKAYRGYNSYVAPFARYEYQIDLADMYSLQKDKAQPRYALVVIDIFSKLAEALPLHNKNSKSVYEALVSIFDKMGYPISVYSDSDAAFKSTVEEFFKNNAIQHTTTLTHANVAERFIRTLKNGINDRERVTNQNWEKILPIVIKKYNNTVHTTTNHTPLQAHKDSNMANVAANISVKAINKRKYKTINVGDMVKIYTKGKDNYGSRKEQHTRWSNESYKIVKIDKDVTLNTYYVLEGLSRHYHRHELLGPIEE